MDSPGFALFDTAVGRCGVAWSRHGVCALQLPERDDDAIRARLRRRSPGAREEQPPADVQALIAGVQALLRGEPADFAASPLDFAGEPPFHRRVYEAARRIPPGATVTYGEIAKQVNGQRSFCWGSWIIPEPRPRGLAVFSALMVYEIGFDTLGLEHCHFDVRTENVGVIRFHERAGAVRVGEEGPDAFFSYSPEAYHRFRASHAATIQAYRGLGGGVGDEA